MLSDVCTRDEQLLFTCEETYPLHTPRHRSRVEQNLSTELDIYKNSNYLVLGDQTSSLNTWRRKKLRSEVNVDLHPAATLFLQDF